jgi:hypothetical protein
VKDVTRHPATKAVVDACAEWYDRHFDPLWRDRLLCVPDEDGRHTARLFQIPRTSADLRSITEVNISSVEQFAYSEFMMSLPDPTAFYAVTMHPLDGLGALELNPSVAFMMVDRMLGGSGNAAERTAFAARAAEAQVGDQAPRSMGVRLPGPSGVSIDVQVPAGTSLNESPW